NAVALGVRRPHGDALLFKHSLACALPGSDDPVGYLFFFGLNSFDCLVEQDIAITQPSYLLPRAGRCQSALPRAAKTWGDGPSAASPLAGPRKPIPPCSRLDRYRMAACLCRSKEASCVSISALKRLAPVGDRCDRSIYINWPAGVTIGQSCALQ